MTEARRVYGIRLCIEELALIKRAAKKAGINWTSWVRRAAMRAVAEEIAPSRRPSLQELIRLAERDGRRMNDKP